jgi:hypothetical protein
MLNPFLIITVEHLSYLTQVIEYLEQAGFDLSLNYI